MSERRFVFAMTDAQALRGAVLIQCIMREAYRLSWDDAEMRDRMNDALLGADRLFAYVGLHQGLGKG